MWCKLKTPFGNYTWGDFEFNEDMQCWYSSYDRCLYLTDDGFIDTVKVTPCDIWGWAEVDYEFEAPFNWKAIVNDVMSKNVTADGLEIRLGVREKIDIKNRRKYSLTSA